MSAALHLASATPERIRELLPWLSRGLPDGDFRRILIKPNWVKHQERDAFPVEALITSSALIEVLVESCLTKYPGAERITVGDVPLQSCDWERLQAQADLDRLTKKFASPAHAPVRFLDLRRERYSSRKGYLHKDDERAGDPLGYREVVVDRESYLEPLGRARFRVSDYDPDAMASRHRPGYHRYLVAGSALDSDLIINVPKMKTHQKAGLTGALKNLVGLNGDKACLAHHRQGQDEFPPDTPRLIRLQAHVREALQKRGRLAFAMARPAWQLLKHWRGIATEGTHANLDAGRMYVGAGSWYGNDTIWRMVYDLNRILRYAPADGGPLASAPQRRSINVLDAIVAGEGNGPLQPLPVHTGLVALAEDPFVIDLAMAQLMGFDWRKIPLLAHHREFRDPVWGQIGVADIQIEWGDRRAVGLQHLPCRHRFRPPPGWKGHIEAAS